MNDFNLKEIIQYSGTAIITFALVRLHLFYGEFGIPIFSYLGFSEILISFFQIIGSFLARFFAEIVAMLGAIGLSFLLKRITVEKLKLEGLQILAVISILASAYIYYLVGQTDDIVQKSSLKKIETMIAQMLLFSFVISSLPATWYKKRRQAVIGISAIIYGCMISMMLTFIEVYKIQYRDRHEGVRIELADKSILPDSLYRYIGRTEKYLFVFDKRQKAASVFNISDIRSVQYPIKFNPMIQ